MERVGELSQLIRSQPQGHALYAAAWLEMKHRSDRMTIAHAVKRFAVTAPELVRYYEKASVAGGTPADLAWMGNVIPDPDHIFADWIVKLNRGNFFYAALASAAVPVGFLTRTIVDTGTATAGFVGPGRAIPLAKLSLDGMTVFPVLKLSLLMAFTNELLEAFNSSIQANIERRLDTAVIRGLENGLLNPSVGAVTDESPASLLNGISPLSSAGTSAANMATDVQTLVRPHLEQGADPRAIILVGHPETLLSWSLTDHAAFKNVGALGGTVAGIKAVSSVACKTTGSPTEKFLAAIDASKILLADSGAVSLSSTRQATLEMSDSPLSYAGSPPVAAQMVSLFQSNATALKIRRFMNWKRTMDEAVRWMTVTY